MIKRITSLDHPIVKHLTKLRINSDYRHEHQSAVIEGAFDLQLGCKANSPLWLNLFFAVGTKNLHIALIQSS